MALSRIVSAALLGALFAMPALAQQPSPPQDPRLAAAILNSGVIEKWHEAENRAALLQAQLSLALEDKAALDKWVRDYFAVSPEK